MDDPFTPVRSAHPNPVYPTPVYPTPIPRPGGATPLSECDNMEVDLTPRPHPLRTNSCPVLPYPALTLSFNHNTPDNLSSGSRQRIWKLSFQLVLIFQPCLYMIPATSPG